MLDEADDEGDDEGEDAERFREHDRKDHVGDDLAGCLGVATDSFHGPATDKADADCGTKHAEACGDGHTDQLCGFKFHIEIGGIRTRRTRYGTRLVTLHHGAARKDG